MSEETEKAENARLDLCAKHGLDVEGRFIKDRQGRSIYVLDSGESGRPVLFVHGGGADAGQWIPLAARVHAFGRRVVLADRPGHGLSYPIEYGNVDYREAAADWCEDVCEAIADRPIDLVANSMGGFFALAFALRRPEAIRTLVTLGAPAGLDRWIPYPLRMMAFKPFNRLLFWQSRGWGVEEYRQMFDDMLVFDADAIDDDELEVALAMSRLPGRETAWRTLLEECVSLSGFNHMIRDEVAELTVPVRFVWGDADGFAPPSSGRELAGRMPDATLDVVENAGHLPWLDRPEECARLVNRALGDGREDRAVA